jgi:hypothetical protein
VEVDITFRHERRFLAWLQSDDVAVAPTLLNVVFYSLKDVSGHDDSLAYSWPWIVAVPSLEEVVRKFRPKSDGLTGVDPDRHPVGDLEQSRIRARYFDTHQQVEGLFVVGMLLPIAVAALSRDLAQQNTYTFGTSTAPSTPRTTPSLHTTPTAIVISSSRLRQTAARCSFRDRTYGRNYRILTPTDTYRFFVTFVIAA